MDTQGNDPTTEPITRATIKQSNRIVIVGGLLSLITFVLMDGALLPLSLAVTVAIVWSFLSLRRHGAHVGAYVASLAVAFVLVMTVALEGFYGNHTQTVPFGTGGTWVSDKSPLTAARDTLIWPNTFAASLLGYDCGVSSGRNCSTPLWLAGAGITYGVISLGTIGGTVLATKRKTDQS